MKISGALILLVSVMIVSGCASSGNPPARNRDSYCHQRRHGNTAACSNTATCGNDSVPAYLAADANS